MHVSVILVAGGTGSRMGTATPKQFLILKKKPIILYSLEAFLSLSEVDEIIVVCDKSYRNLLPIDNRIKFADPGPRRQDSVFNGLKACSNNNLICIHDAARPLITKQSIQETLLAAENHGAAVLANREKNTVKRATTDQFVEKTIPRDALWEIQTPQVIKRSLLEEGFAFAQEHQRNVTDDVSLIEMIDKPIKLIEGPSDNIKITHPSDLKFAEALISKRNQSVKSIKTSTTGSYKYRLDIAYDGTDYCGWQVQPKQTSIQGLIENALEILLKTRTHLCGSGRTDSGVHALNQVAHFSSSTELDCNRFCHSLNALLPFDIRIQKMQRASHDFHARFSATSKTYHYHLHLNSILNPFTRRLRTHYTYPINLPLMREAMQKFIGTHDFRSFTNEGSSANENTTRTIKRFEMKEQDGGIRLEIEGNGFLYKMVRNIVGLLLEIASGKRSIEDIQKIFSARDRKASGSAAPPQGLFLATVCYDQLDGISANVEKCTAFSTSGSSS